MPWEAWYFVAWFLMPILLVPASIGKEKKPMTEWQGVSVTIVSLINIALIAKLAGVW